MNEKLDLLSEGFGLNKAQRSLLLRVGWVIAVSGVNAYLLGALAVFGIPAPYARANDFEELKRITAASARVTLSKEIREQSRIKCSATDQAIVDSITRYIDSLQLDYERIAGQRYPEPECPRRP